MGVISNYIRSSKLFRSFLITSFGSGISKIILIVGTFYCTNVLTKLEFGEYSFVRNTLIMLLTICASNFSGLCTKFAAEAASSHASLKRLFLLFIFSLFVCIIFGIILLVLPSETLVSILGSENNILYFKFAALLMPLFMVQPLIEGTLRGRMHFKIISWLQVVSSVLYVISLVLGIKLDGVNGAIWGLYIYYAIYAIASFISLIKSEPIIKCIPNLSKFWLEYRSIFKMVLPVFILSFVEAPIFWYLQVLMNKYASAEAVGTMTVIKQVRNIALLIPNYFFITYIAFAGKLNADKEYEKYFSQFDKLIRLFGLSGIAMLLIITVCCKFILSFFGTVYIQDWPILIIGCLGIPIALMMSLIKQSLILQEHQIQLMFISISWNILWIVLFYILINLGVGVVSSFFISEIISWIINIVSSFILYQRDKKRLLVIKNL